jgi:hypothetical protein
MADLEHYCSPYAGFVNNSALCSHELMGNDLLLMVYRTDGVSIITGWLAVSGGNFIHAQVYTVRKIEVWLCAWNMETFVF